MVPPIESRPAMIAYPSVLPTDDVAAPRRTVGVGVVGYGYWGPNLVRNFNTTPGARIVAVSDLSPNRLADVRAHYPAVKTTPYYEDMLLDPEVDAVAISSERGLSPGGSRLIFWTLQTAANSASAMLTTTPSLRRQSFRRRMPMPTVSNQRWSDAPTLSGRRRASVIRWRR